MAELKTLLTANPGTTRRVCLFKFTGDAVQAVKGGGYHQFGGSVAHRLFHTRILPHILLPGKVEGVPAEFHQKVLVLCEHMGGVDGNLLPVSDRNPPDLEATETVQPKKTA